MKMDKGLSGEAIARIGKKIGAEGAGNALQCRFHPQAWVRDYAMDVDPEGPTDWSVPWTEGKPVPSNDDYESDDLRFEGNAPEWVRNWGGPFYVEILNRDDFEATASGVKIGRTSKTSLSIKEVKQLHPGDEVFWNDPDDGLASRVYKIRNIEFVPPNAVIIEEDDGSVLECFAHELS
jgi:hypothetical protein